MSTPERERLLCDVLSDPSHAEFRRELLERSLSELRDHHRHRTQHRWLALAACLALVLGLSALLRFAPSRGSRGVPPFVTWHTQPLLPGQRLTTSASTVTVVRTSQASTVLVVARTSPVIVQTDPERYPFQRLTDGELLGLFEGQPMALVAISQEHRRLLFLGPDGGAEFLADPSRYPY